MRQKLAGEALKQLSLKIGSLWVGINVSGWLVGSAPDKPTADDATKLIEKYIRARAAYEGGDYLGAIEIATEDEE